MKNFERLFIITAIAAILVAIPISAGLSRQAETLKVERGQKQELQLKLETKTEQLQQKDQQIQQQQQQIENKDKELQSKRNEEAKLAAIKADFAHLGEQCQQYAPLVAKYDWDNKIAMAIMKAESGCRAVTPDNSAANYDGVADHGLMQIHGVPLNDPAANVEYAYKEKYEKGGWTHWTVYKTGAYLQYL